jgi:hypothetical protein
VCKQLYLSSAFHNCQGNKCRFCNKQFTTRTAFNLHFYGPPSANFERVECAVCCKLMPEHCRAVHEPKCKGRCVRCPDCNEYYQTKPASNPRSITREQHLEHCGQRFKFCVNCDSLQAPDHQCVISRCDFSYDWDKDRQRKTMFFFDLECMKKGEMGEQVVTYACVREGLEPEKDESREEYYTRLQEHFTTTPPLEFTSLRDLCVFMYKASNSIFIAHNMSGYDGPIVINYLMYDLGLGPKIKPVMVGLKVMYARWGSNSMMDSANHLKTSLASLPKLVGLNIPGLKKGHFPHDFNTVENHSYKGPLPGKEFYNIEQSKEDPAEFDAWYAEQQASYEQPGKVFDLRAEEKTYCQQDVLVLATCWCYHRLTAILVNRVDPNTCPTIASYSMKSYRTSFIPERGIVTLTPEVAAAARAAVKGGRCEPRRPYLDLRDTGEELICLDVCSLYPAVQLNRRYPDRFIKTWTEGEIPEQSVWMQWCGVMKCKRVLPPPYDPSRRFKVPYLGAKSSSGKFEFNWEVKEDFTATVFEVRRAIELGYTVEGVEFIHQFSECDDMFRSFVLHYIKLKAEFDSPPKDQAAEDELCATYFDRLGIVLDRVELRKPKNVGAYAVTKNILNSLWGKITQRELDTTELVNPASFHKVMARDARGEVELKGFYCDPFLPDVYSVSYKEKKKRECMSLLKTNALVGAHVTAYGRDQLYELFGAEEHENDTVYCDTDSVFMVKPKGYKFPGEASFLGSWSREGRERCYTQSIFISPKVYALLDPVDPSGVGTKIRIKGFPMHNLAQSLLNFSDLRALQVDAAERRNGTASGVDYDEDDAEEYKGRRFIAVPYNQFIRQMRGGVYVPSARMMKLLRFNETTLKSRWNPTGVDPDGPYLPFGHGVERLALEPNTNPPNIPKRGPLPKRVCVPMSESEFKALVGEGLDEDEDAEMTDSQAEAAMAEAASAYDAAHDESLLLLPDDD